MKELDLLQGDPSAAIEAEGKENELAVVQVVAATKLGETFDVSKVFDAQLESSDKALTEAMTVDPAANTTVTGAS